MCISIHTYMYMYIQMCTYVCIYLKTNTHTSGIHVCICMHIFVVWVAASVHITFYVNRLCIHMHLETYAGDSCGDSICPKTNLLHVVYGTNAWPNVNQTACVAMLKTECVCVYTQIFICVYTCVYTFIDKHVCMYVVNDEKLANVYVHVYICVYIYMYRACAVACASIYVHVYVYEYVYVPVHVHLYVHVNVNDDVRASADGWVYAWRFKADKNTVYGWIWIGPSEAKQLKRRDPDKRQSVVSGKQDEGTRSEAFVRPARGQTNQVSTWLPLYNGKWFGSFAERGLRSARGMLSKDRLDDSPSSSIVYAWSWSMVLPDSLTS